MHLSPIWRLSDVVEYLNLSKNTILRIGESDPTFPRRVQLTERTVGYDAQSIINWKNAKFGLTNTKTS